MTYSVKEVFFTLQGEGAHAGRVAVFCRFSGCNLWSGREEDRAGAICKFCDTDFVGTDGLGGGKFADADSLAKHIDQFWGDADPKHKYVVFTGGEPLLQLDEPLIKAVKLMGFGHPTKVEDERSRNSIFILSINGQEYAFDKEELLYWLRYV